MKFLVKWMNFKACVMPIQALPGGCFGRKLLYRDGKNSVDTNRK